MDALLGRARIEIEFGLSGELRVMAGGSDVTGRLRAPEVGEDASRIAVLTPVRRWMVERQRELARREGRVVMEGRDIGTVVLTDAEVKVFLVASAEERARRRYRERIAQGKAADYEAILEEQRLRDARDRNRKDSPLIPAADAVNVETDGKTIEAVENEIGRWIEKVDRGLKVD